MWTIDADDEGEYWRAIGVSLCLDTQYCVLIIEKTKGEIIAFYTTRSAKESADGKYPQRSLEEWRRITEERERINPRGVHLF